MDYLTLPKPEQEQACADVWQALTTHAGSKNIHLGWAGMSVHEAIRTQTRRRVEQTPQGWKLDPEDFRSLARLIEHPAGADEVAEAWDRLHNPEDWD